MGPIISHHSKWVLISILILYAAVCSTTVMAARSHPVKHLLHEKAFVWHISHIIVGGSKSATGSDSPPSPSPGVCVSGDPSIFTPVSSPAPSDPLPPSFDEFLPKSPSSTQVSSSIPSAFSTTPKPILAPDNSPSNPVQGSLLSSGNSQLVNIHAGVPSTHISPTSSQNSKKHVKVRLSHAAVGGIGFGIFLFLVVVVFIAYHAISGDTNQDTGTTTASPNAPILHSYPRRG